MFDEIKPVDNWGDFLSMGVINACDREPGRCYTVRVKAKWGLNAGAQDILLCSKDFEEYEIKLKNLLQGGEEECNIRDLDSKANLTIRKRSRGNMEILGSIIRDNPGYQSEKESVMHFKFEIKPEGIVDILNLLSYLRSQ